MNRSMRSVEEAGGSPRAVEAPSLADGTGAAPVADPARLRPMLTADLPRVQAVEAAAYPFPWTRGNFIDSLAAGYPARLLEDAGGALLGYWIAMPGVDEMHLLNITVAPDHQGRGHARRLMEALFVVCREHRAGRLWLEVRAGNERARAIYGRLGFEASGRRRNYYPAPMGRREDAIVMSLALRSATVGAADALG